MKIIEIPIGQLCETPWNANQMDDIMLNRLKGSVQRFELVQPLVVRATADSHYEVLSGNQRPKALKDMGYRKLPCVIVDLDDADAMLLAQVLNDLHGEDNLGKKGALFKDILSDISESEVLLLLPETMDSLRALASISEADMAQHLKAWEQAQSARLSHMQLQLTSRQLEVVEEAIRRIQPRVKKKSFDNPNTRSNTVYLICRSFLDRRSDK